VSVATVPLGELCGILSGFAWSASKFNKDKRGVPIIRIQNVDAVLGNDFVYWDEPYDERFVIRQGDLLLTLSGSFRIESWSGPDALLNQRIIKLTPSPKLDRGWLLHVLRPRLGQIERLGKHALVNNVSLGDIRNLAIPLPPLAEQRRIAEVLGWAEALRAKRRATLSQVDSLTQSLFLDLFGDPFRHQRGWPTFQFSEVCETTQGVQIPRDEQKEEPSEGYERYLYINDFYSDDSPKYIEDRHQQKRVTNDDLVMANTGSPGRVFKGRPGILSNNLFKITFDTEKISTVFFYHFLASDLFQRHLQAQMKQGIQSHLGHKTFGVQKLPLPPIELQREFARRVTAVEKLKTAQRASLAELDVLFATLQHRAFRGEL
jgi:type I restriction enzyme S subunit